MARWRTQAQGGPGGSQRQWKEIITGEGRACENWELELAAMPAQRADGCVHIPICTRVHAPKQGFLGQSESRGWRMHTHTRLAAARTRIDVVLLRATAD